jgi:hypothetical protein
VFIIFMIKGIKYVCGIGGLGWLGKKMYDANGDIHRFEYLVIASLRKLPLYPPPTSLPVADQVSNVTAQIPAEISQTVVEWFLKEDAGKKSGVLRQDVLDFLTANTVLTVSDKVLEEFLSKGRGRGPEQQRLSECSLLSAVTFVRDVVKTNGPENVDKTKKKLSGEEELGDIERAVLEKELASLKSKSDSLSEAESSRLQEIDARLSCSLFCVASRLHGFRSGESPVEIRERTGERCDPDEAHY